LIHDLVTYSKRKKLKSFKQLQNSERAKKLKNKQKFIKLPRGRLYTLSALSPQSSSTHPFKQKSKYVFYYHLKGKGEDAAAIVNALQK